MWSGPRNISTALMRAWENRADTDVWDEPFYGHYLYRTGIPHPGADEVIASQGKDWQQIARKCVGQGPTDAPIFYQKHMTMHLLPDIDRDWLSDVTNCFLIRAPDQVVASYARVRDNLTLDDLGFVQQARLFEYVAETSGRSPLVIDSTDFLIDPQGMLRLICRKLAIPFRPEMMRWPAGPRESDGVWGKYWYHNVWKSTGFEPPFSAQRSLSPALQTIAEAAQPYYDRLHPFRVQLEEPSATQ